MTASDTIPEAVVELVPEESAPPPPARVGRYEVRREIGRGGMAVVYQAIDPALGRLVALKIVEPPGEASSADRALFEERFFAEARIAAGFSHPGIVTVHDVGRDDSSGTLFMALEYLGGRTLADLLLHEGPLPWREAMRIAARLSEALHYAHSKGVVHRDVKPANVMLLPDGAPKLLDFGIAQAATGTLRLGAGGLSFGTPLYMSPEQVRNETVDGRSDLFSLGAVAYALVTGKVAFVGASLAEIADRVMSFEPPPPSRAVPGLPVEVDRVIGRALAKSATERYGDGEQMAAEIRDLLTRPATGGEDTLAVLVPDAHLDSAPITRPLALRPQATLTSPREPSAAPRRSWRGHRWGLALLLVAVAAGIVGDARTGQGQTAPAPVAVDPPGPALPAPTPPPETAAVPKARLYVKLEHPLSEGTLRIWIDGAPLLSATLRGTGTSRIVGVKVSKGELSRVLEVPPGRHAVRVRIAWDDNEKTEEIIGAFAPGATRRLDIHMGRLRKNLSVDWS
jgi:eukaryotic-like serine/threonine-protein kinase